MGSVPKSVCSLRRSVCVRLQQLRTLADPVTKWHADRLCLQGILDYGVDRLELLLSQRRLCSESRKQVWHTARLIQVKRLDPECELGPIDPGTHIE